MIKTYASIPVAVQDEAVLFAFDDHSITLRDNLLLTLKQVQKHPANPVLRRGPEGAPDHHGCIIYGSVLPIEGRLRMWYLAYPREEDETTGPEGCRPMAYAESEDGVHWVKPNLGLVEWQGSKDNNLCLIEPDHSLRDVNYICVMHDPEDPDPARRYKASYIFSVPSSALRRHVPRKHSVVMATATSADGLRWQLVNPDRLDIPDQFEVSGIYRFAGMYHASGQQGPAWALLPDGQPAGRVMTVYQSPDFVHWSLAKSLAFVRPGYVSAPISQGEEVHAGAGIWNRGNVLVGLYGMWHGAPGWDNVWPHFQNVRIDLGLVVSNDGLHFREPVPDFAVVPRGGHGEWDSAALVQGHAFANMGERTYIWYAQWDCTRLGHPMEIGLGMLRRDGFGHLSRRQWGIEGYFITCAVEVDRPAGLYVNAEGVSQASPLRVELLDGQNRPLAGYAGEACVPIVESGVRQPVRWRDRGVVEGLEGKAFKVKVALAGEGEQKVYALYFAHEQQGES